jgi:site-specific DNA-methyltransferase (adenine-specific)
MPELTLYNGDCLEIMKELPEKSVDLIICDLPYGCLNGKGMTEAQKETNCANKFQTIFSCAWDVKIDLKAFWEQVRRIRKNEHTPTIHFCTTKFGYELIQSNEAEFRYDLVWDKQRGVSFLTANKMPMRSHEMIYAFL